MATIISHSPAETEALGVEFASHLRGGEILALEGMMGAGKTHFVKGLARGLGCSSEATSPTFTLIHEYGGGRLPLVHADLYRLECGDEAAAIGLEDYFDGECVVIVEWADKFPGLLPAEALRISIRLLEGDNREVVLP